MQPFRARISPSEAVSEQAAQWFAEVSDERCPPARKQALMRWLEASAEHQTAFDEIEALWGHSALAVKDREIADLAAKTLRFEQRESSRAKAWLGPVAAVAAAVLVGVILLPRWLAPPPPATTYTTQVGEQKTVTLKDGSVVVLDTATTLTERYRDQERRINLDRGRAQFKVRHDPGRPFVVTVAGGTVKALGTEFQVQRMGQLATVTLISGRLAVSPNENPEGPGSVRIGSGQKVAFQSQQEIGAVGTADLQTVQSWTDGKLFVRDWKLSELLAETNRYTPAKIVLADPALGDIRISGVFRPTDQKTLLLVLEQGWNMQARKVSPERVEVSRK